MGWYMLIVYMVRIEEIQWSFSKVICSVFQLLYCYLMLLYWNNSWKGGRKHNLHFYLLLFESFCCVCESKNAYNSK